MMDFENETRGLSQVGTGGAIQKRNEKGEITMEKVKVARYVAGKRPDYAVNSSDESDGEDFQAKQAEESAGMNGSSALQSFASSRIPLPRTTTEAADPRLKRLFQHMQQSSSSDQPPTRRRPNREVSEPEIIQAPKQESRYAGREQRSEERENRHRREERGGLVAKTERRRKHSSESSSSGEEEDDKSRAQSSVTRIRQRHPDPSDDDEDANEEDHHQRRLRMLQKAKMRKTEDEELLAKEEEDDEKKLFGYSAANRAQDLSEEESEYEDMSSSEDEDAPSRLKPVFISRQDRLSAKDKEKEKEVARAREFELRRVKEERRREALRIVEQIRKTEVEERKSTNVEGVAGDVESIRTDDEDVEEAYEAWKVRELKRIKRDREAREKLERERDEIERIHDMTEEERKLYFRQNPTTVTNKMPKGKYKFLQKYYHRGAFYLDDEEDVYKRDITAPTLEDHFDKTVLPKVMQVKNFGRSGRTKYTHLVDQDTTEFSSPWGVDSTHALKFHMKTGGGMKEVYDRPSTKATKKT